MRLTFEQSRKLKSARILLLAGMVLGPLYTLFSDGFGPVYPYVNTLIIGTLVALIFIVFELFLFTGPVRKLKFYKILFLRIFLYSVSIIAVITLVLMISRMIRYQMDLRSVYLSEEFQRYLWEEDFLVGNLYTLAIVAIVILIMQISRKISPKVLLGIISGKYNRPRELERIVMFIEIMPVKPIIEQIGRVNFFRYLNDILFDITETILFHKGEIYEYVENEIVLVWDPKKGVREGNCVRTFFEIGEVIEDKKITYFEKYGFIPEFHASLHIGKVIMGEIGDVKSDIKYHGDVMNTGSRILGLTDRENDFLVSAELIGKIDLPVLYRKERLGLFELKGKNREVEVFSLKENEAITF